MPDRARDAAEPAPHINSIVDPGVQHANPTYGQPDPSFAAILADPRTSLTPPRTGTDLAAYRRRLDAPLAAVTGPAMHDVTDVSMEHAGRPIRLRQYAASARTRGTILFVHGGGFVIGSLDTHDALCRSLAVATGARIVAVDYRLAPEHPHPAARDDCLAALDWAAATDDANGAVCVCGDSAGAYLAVEVALAAARPAAALGLLYPVVASGCTTGSWAACGGGHVLTHAWMRWAWSAFRGGDAADVSLLEARLDRLPPTCIITAACDPLRDEGEALAGAIARAGSYVSLTRFEGMIHGFASLPMLTPRASDAVSNIAGFLGQHMC